MENTVDVVEDVADNIIGVEVTIIFMTTATEVDTTISGQFWLDTTNKCINPWTKQSPQPCEAT